VETKRATTPGFIGLVATLFALNPAAGDREARADSQPRSATLEAVPREVEGRIEALVRRWFAEIDDPSVEAEALGELLAEPPFELVLDGTALHDRRALLARVATFRATYPEVDHRIDPIRIQAEAPSRFRVHFEFDRHAVDEAGLPHVARREHTWIVLLGPDARPVISKMTERPLLFFPGSGPQIVCY